ncbi:transposase [Streptomyces sp. NPDC059224]|uniref:transposase n=1 Tax=Streptomyces sp. NPDC059224 TaxID=3346775 RepID=UPI0036A2A7D8
MRRPAGNTGLNRSPAQQHGRDVVVVKFPTAACRACPFQSRCATSPRGRRRLTLRPQELREAVTAARATQQTRTWQAKYALRAGMERTVNRALDTTGMRRARCRGLAKVRLRPACSATAINMIRLGAHWSEHPLSRTRTRTLGRLNYRLTA